VSGPNDPEGARARFIAAARSRARELGVATTSPRVTRADLDASDPTGGMRRAVAIFSMGNACEAHGPALPPDIDDRTGAAIATRVACASGARYVGHVPYATDGVGDLAREWSPAYMPLDDFYAATAELVGTLLRCSYDAAGESRPRVVAFVSGHGGNAAITPHLARLAGDLGVERCLYSLSMRVPDGERGVQHADAIEHSVARALGRGCLDEARLAAVDAEIRDDAAFFAMLRTSPAIAGMSGFYVFGDGRFDVLRARYAGMKESVRAFAEERRVDADVERGRRIVEHTVETIAREIIDVATALGVRAPWFAR
jgi:creatinine amidohydrolase/Fe(II)-dependent formamide hydrolase-like protein